MTDSKTYDVTYPGIAPGIETIQTDDNAMSMEQLVAHVGGTMEEGQTVRPTNIDYGYIPVARD